LKSTIERRKWLTHYAPLIIWTLLILGLGSSMGSMNETSRFVRPLLEFLFPNAAPETLTFIHGNIRKLAHFVEYGVLGFLAMRAFKTLAKLPFRSSVFAFFLCVAVALLDEYQQSFNPSRTSSSLDVMIDLTGATAAIAVYTVLIRRRLNANSAKSSEP
jgi:VanZ family protein